MKYVYFDCFAGFDPIMAAGALLSLGSKELADKIISGHSDTALTLKDVRRYGIEATLSQITINTEVRFVKTDGLIKAAEGLDISESALNGLKQYINIKAAASAINPEDAEFEMSSELPLLFAAAIVFECVHKLNAQKIVVSPVGISNAQGLFEPLTKPETMYIFQKYNITSKPLPVSYELCTPSGAALLASLGAVSGTAPSGSIIKIGYGAGETDFEEIPNILRIVYGENSEGDALSFEAEKFMADIFSEVAYL